MKRVVWWSAAWVLLLSGCVNVDYVGQCFDPIPEGEPVSYFSSREEVAPGKYRIIGRAVITTVRRYDKYDIRELLLDEARKRGADAVVLVGVKKTFRGVYEREPDQSVTDISPHLHNNLRPDGSELEVSFDRSEPLIGEHHGRRELELRVLFLKDREALEQQLARRGRELDRLVKQPDPGGRPPEKNAAEKTR